MFTLRCAACHAISPAGRAKMGPNLSNIGADAATRVPGTSALSYIVESIVDPGAFAAEGAEGAMPSGLVADLSAQNVRHLVAYVGSKGASVSYTELLELDVNPRAAGHEPTWGRANLKARRRGEELFMRRLGCNSCHGLFDDTGDDWWAPPLAQAALLSKDYVRQSVRKPSAVIAPGYRQVTLELGDGSSYSGQLWHKQAESVSILRRGADGAPQIEVFSLKEGTPRSVLNIVESTMSGMPPYDLTIGEEADIVAFLGSLRAHANRFK